MNSFERIKNRNIIVDTNVIIDYSTKDFPKRSGEFLDKLVKKGNTLFVSQFTGMELLRDTDEGETANKYRQFLSEIDNVEVTFSVIKNAIQLSRDYRTLLCGRKVDLADLVIGGTAILRLKEKETGKIGSQSLLLTENRKDFPELIWKCLACHAVLDKDPSGKSTRVNRLFYLLEFNTHYLSRVKNESSRKLRGKS